MCFIWAFGSQCDSYLMFFFQIRGDIVSTLSGLVNKLFYVDQFPEFSAIVSVASDDIRQEVSFYFLCVIFLP